MEDNKLLTTKRERAHTHTSICNFDCDFVCVIRGRSKHTM